MKSKMVKNQIRLFVIITAGAMIIMGLFYVRLPDQLGIGRYDVTVELADSGGLYPKALVTYRGFEVGQVSSLDLRPEGGVLAHLEIDNSADIPADARVYVRSASIIGEQYVDFVPVAGGSSAGETLSGGEVIPMAQTELPTTTTAFVDSIDALLASVPRKDLQTVVRELGLASDDVGADVARMISDGQALFAEADANLPQTTALLEGLEPVLSTQEALDPNIRRYARSLRDVTRQLEISDPDLEGILRAGPGFAEEVVSFTSGLQTQLPGMLWETAAVGQVARVYKDNIEHILIVLPPAAATFIGVIPPETRDDPYVRANLDFKMSFPTACTAGFPEADNMRDPSDVSLGPLPIDSYCRPPAGSDLVARGARNNPCPNSNERSATAAGCGLVFDPEAVKRRRTFERANVTVFDPKVAQLLAPNGPLFLLDVAAAPGPETWQGLLMELVGK